MVGSSDEEDEDILHIRDFDHDLGEGQFRFRDDLRTTSLNDIESDEDEDNVLILALLVTNSAASALARLPASSMARRSSSIGSVKSGHFPHPLCWQCGV